MGYNYNFMQKKNNPESKIKGCSMRGAEDKTWITLLEIV